MGIFSMKASIFLFIFVSVHLQRWWNTLQTDRSEDCEQITIPSIWQPFIIKVKYLFHRALEILKIQFLTTTTSVYII